MSQPATRQTLAVARESGQLKPLDRKRIRAQFAMLDRFQAADIRRALGLLLSRLSDLYEVIAYTGPGYVYGRVDSEYPSALYAMPVQNYMDGSWMYQEMSPAHPTCTIERLIHEAGSMCLQTACKVAQAELCQDVPEAQELFRLAGRAVLSMAAESELSGVRWSDARRRLGAPGIRKMLKRLEAALPESHVGWSGGTVPVVVPATLEERLRLYRDVTDWSYAEPAVALAS